MKTFISKSEKGTYWPSVIVGSQLSGVSSWIDDSNEEPSFQQLNLNAMIESLIEQKVHEKINEMMEKRQTVEFRDVTMGEAKSLLSNFISQQHKVGIFQISLLDVVLALKLPPDQVEKIMDSFIKNKKIKEL